MGRPTSLTEEVVQQARDYLADFSNDDSVIPSVAGLSMRLKIARSTIYDWNGQGKKLEITNKSTKLDKLKKSFSDTLDEILAKQESILWNKGLSNEFNSNITKLALVNHGYFDKSKTDITSGDKPLQDNRYQEIAEKYEQELKQKLQGE